MNYGCYFDSLLLPPQEMRLVASWLDQRFWALMDKSTRITLPPFSLPKAR